MESYIVLPLPTNIDKTVFASLTEGRQKIAAFKPLALPAALVPVDKIEKFPRVNSGILESGFNKAGNFYVIQESNLDSSKIYPRMYLKEIYPNDCNQSDGIIH